MLAGRYGRRACRSWSSGRGGSSGLFRRVPAFGSRRAQTRRSWSRNFVESRLVICRDQDLLSLVFARLKRHRAGAAIVFRGTARPRITDIVGIITKRAIADAVIDSYED